jgi:hypothetical protein
VTRIKSGHKKALIIGVAAIAIASVPIALLLTSPGFRIVINPVNPAEMGVAEWLEDFEYLYNYMERNYPFLSVKSRTHGYNWLDLRSVFETRITNAQDNTEFLAIIASACLALQNRHTAVMPPSVVASTASDYADLYPVNMVFCEAAVDAADYWNSIYNSYSADLYGWIYDADIVYDRGEYILRDYSASLHDLYGDDITIIEVDGVPIDDAIDTCYDKDYIEYDYYRSKRYLRAIYPLHFGNSAVFTIRNATGYETGISFSVVAGQARSPYTYPGTPVVTATYPGDSVGYLYVGSFGDTVDQYYDTVIDFYEQIENYDYLIIDVRGNTGGYYSKWIDGIVEPLIQSEIVHTQHLAYRTDPYVQYMQAGQLTTIIPKSQFSYLPPEVLTSEFQIHQNIMTYSPLGEINFDGEIAVLTDSVVYSAAEGFTNFCKDYNFATLYGTHTGGDGIIVSPLYFILPNSKLVISSASACGLDATGHANEEVKTAPDVFYESAFGNWSELIDYTIADLTSS